MGLGKILKYIEFLRIAGGPGFALLIGMKRALSALALITVLTNVSGVYAKANSRPDARIEALSYLRDMRSANVKRLIEIDDALRARIEESSASAVEFEVSRLQTAKREHALRQEFLDRLILQVDTRFMGGDLRIFLERALTEMAKIDATNSAANPALWKFLKFASEVIRRLPEKNENIVMFLEGYMNRSVANPIRPEDFLNSRNYSNGLESESGHPLERDEVGAVADSRIKSLPEEPAEEPKPEPVKVSPAPSTPAEISAPAATPAQAPVPPPAAAAPMAPAAPPASVN